MLANQGILFVCKSVFDLSVYFVWLLFGYCLVIVFTMCPMHTDCIYLVPSISSFHIVYFCGMYVPVKMQIRVFIFNLQDM